MTSLLPRLSPGIKLMNTFLTLLPAIIFVIIISVFMTHHKKRGLRKIEKWAQNEGLEILSSEYRWVKRGPDFISSINHQRIFYVTVKDESGNIRRCWIKVGGFLFGILSDKMDVRWEP